jgi:chromosome segregation ATPase
LKFTENLLAESDSPVPEYTALEETLLILKYITMKSTLIESPIRTIKLDFEEERPFTNYETQLIARYSELHKILAVFESEMQETETRCEEMNALVEDVKERLKEVKKRLHEYLALEDALGTKNTSRYTLGSRKVMEEGEKYNEFVRLFHQSYLDISTRLDKYCEDFDKLTENWDDRFEQQLEEFDEFASELYSNYENYQLDMERFDDDHEEFLEFTNNLNDRMTALNELMDNTIENFNAASNEISLFYNFVENQRKFRKSGSPEMLN